MLQKLLSGLSAPENVVWTAADIEDFRRAVLPLAVRAQEKGVDVVYIHYSGCDVLFEEQEKLRMFEIPLSHRFEAFTVAVYDLISEGAEGILYLFDPLSMLQAAWATDLMMENFFTVITGLVRRKKGTAFYPLLRSRHSVRSYEHIRSRTSAFLELYSDFKNLYLRPVRFLPRTSDQECEGIFVPHIFDASQSAFVPIRDGVLESHFRKAVNLELRKGSGRNLDSWDRFFDRVQRDYEDGRDVGKDCDIMAEVMMSRDEKIVELLRENFEPEDYFFVKEHMIGTGMIGGKSCGMLTARKIIENHCPEIYDRLEPHDSFFIGSDVFYTYIVENGFWELRVEQKKPEGYFTVAEELAEKLLHGRFPEPIREEFRELLEFYDPSPVIVRSSSILEDGFGNAFAGKYESVFCPGNGTMEERLLEFENAVRVVYASTLSRSALDYRLRRGLQDKDELMAILVQRVSGSYFGEYYFPCAAGVGYSYSAYRFLDSLDPAAGMLRLVMGLGTGAVDRTQGSYPRLVSLDLPEALPYKNGAEHHKYSQRSLDVIDREKGTLEQISFYKIENTMPAYIKRAVFGHDYEAERRLADQGRYRNVWFISCGGLVKNKQLMGDMQTMMQTAQREYGQPVDIEFTINLSEDGEYVINLLQCRPLQFFEDSGRQGIPDDLPEQEVFLDCNHCTLGNSQKVAVDLILYVDPIAYYRMPYNQKNEIARFIGAVNWHFRDRDKNMLLMVPGRIGTSSPELGVPTTFSDISSFRAIFEIAESRAGYNPELSYGSHMFQDLVENEILYAAVFEDRRTRVFRPEAFTGLRNRISEIEPSAKEFEEIVRLYDVRERGCELLHDLVGERIVCLMKEN
ncbi:MAG: PEP/pyruvate-binding domain-containing protein [Eubacteriales bacterium]|nr:PEP/pyruvate-binding domain-containing protein [Eubacteriales bacterium]